MTAQSQRNDEQIISGYFLAPDKIDTSTAFDDGEDESDEDGNKDEFDSIDFSEDKAFSPETHVVNPKSEKLLTVRFKEYGSGLVREIHGRFPLTDPWWSANLCIQKRHHQYQLISIRGYRLRDDDRVVEEKVLMLFLNDCKVPDDHRMALDEFLRHSSSSGLTFKNVYSQLEDFANCSKESKEIVEQIKLRIAVSGGPVQSALRFPKLCEILPQLLPRHFLNIMHLDNEILDNLENALSVTPWVFGFSSILTRFHNVHGCEASFKNFYTCSEVYSQLSDAEKDGLFFYEALKELCCREGHTYVEFWRLKEWAIWKMKKMRESQQDGILNYSMGDGNKGLLFLEKERILVLDVHQGHSRYETLNSHRAVQRSTRVYLARFYFAEKDIAENLEKLMFGGGLRKWDVQIDLESDHFERLRTDKDQMRAAELIAAKPVVVLSGKGGCGKTEVVGRVFSYAQRALAQERMFGQCGLTDEELVENADKQVNLYYAENGKNDLDGNSHESASNGNDAIGNGESPEAADYFVVYRREDESSATLHPTQSYVKCEENGSSVRLPTAQSYVKCEANGSSVMLPTAQSYVKCEENGSSVMLAPAQSYVKCEANGFSVIMLPPAQSYVKCEANGSSVMLPPAQRYVKCGENGSSVTIPPVQMYVKCEENGSSLMLPPAQSYVKCEENCPSVTLPPAHEAADYFVVYRRESESIVTLPPAQSSAKCEENGSSVALGGTQDYGLCGGNDFIESQDNGTDSPVETHMDSGTILLTAPTGKAAILLGRRSGMLGYTLHQVVFSYFAWKRNPSMSWRFSSVRVLIVDECSLVPVTIFQRALKALLDDAQLSKVVLLGDVNQLPSIESGRFLADVYEALDDAGCSITLRTNHRSESQFIIDNAERIRLQYLPYFDGRRHFHRIQLPENSESEDNSRDEAVRDLLKKGVLLSHEKSQFVAFKRRDCDGINELCCKHYNNHSMKKLSKNGKQVMDFRPGDKVCCSRNAYVIDYTKHDYTSLHRASGSKGKAKELPEIRLCNGEIFFIKEMREEKDERDRTIIHYIVLSDLEREIRVDFRQLKNLCKLKHAWARTIHTFQGSETDALVYVVGSAGRFQNWQHVYTAVTRGRQQVHVITKPSCLAYAINRKPIERKTSLKERLQSIIAKQQLQGSQPLNQEESRNVDVIHSSGQTSTLNGSSLDQRPDFVTPVKASPPQNHDVKSVSGGKRKHPDPSAAVHGSPSVKCAKDSSLTDSLVSPLRRKLSLNNV